MELRALLSVLLRRWLWVVAVVVLAVLAGVGVGKVVKPSYQTTASVILLPPADPSAGATNPYLALGNLDAASDVVVASINTDKLVQEMAQKYPSAQFVVAKDTTASAPFVLVTVSAGDPDQALHEMQDIVALVPVRLETLQSSAKVSSTALITSKVVAQSDQPAVVNKSRIRSMAMAVLAVGVLGMAALVGLDALLTRRRARREAAGKLSRRARKRGRRAKTDDASPVSSPADAGVDRADGVREVSRSGAARR